MLRTILPDLRFALRLLRKSPAFTVMAVLAITVGTGAVTTVFSMANAIALRPLAGVTGVEDLVEVHRTLPDGTGSGWVSHPYYQRIRDGAAERRLADVAAWAMMPLMISAGAEGVAAQGTTATGNYFRVLGMRPALGRFFTPEDDTASAAHPVIVLSHGFWTTHLGGDSSIVGRTVRMNGHAVTVVGVAPPRFGGVFSLLRTDVWAPMGMQRELRSGTNILTDPRPGWLQLFARIPPGVDRDVVQGELTRLTGQWVAEGSEPAREWGHTASRLAPFTGLPSDQQGAVLGFMALLLGASGLVLLIASANVAAMLLARAVARRHETAVRLALGASRGRLVRQLLIETLLLYVVGAAGGVLVAVYAAPLLARMPLPMDLPFALDFAPDARVLAFTLVVSLVTGIAFGLAPALQSVRVDVTTRLRNDTSGPGSRRSVARGALIAAQMAVSVLLLVAAGLFLRALDAGRRIELGFDPSNVAVAGFTVGTFGYDDAKRRRFYRTVTDEVARAPGVVAVSYTHHLPLSMYNTAELRIDGAAVPAPRADGTPVRFAEVDARYFDVVRMPIVEGRAFVDADDDRAPRVAVVNQAFARRFWPAGAVGRSFRRGDDVLTVVGVARDAKYSTPRERLEPFVYFPIAQGAESPYHAELLVRTTGDPMQVAPVIRAAVRQFDPLVPVPTVTRLSAEIARALVPQRVAALVTAALGFVGLLLACVGLYGSVAYLVGRRTREIGLRLALGADRRHVLRLVVGEGMRPVVAGTAAGLLLAVVVTRLLRSYLYGVSPLDAFAFAGGAAVLTAVALAATYLPARRAAEMDPARTLRVD